MKRVLSITALLFALAPAAQATEEAVRFGRFGTVHIYREAEQPTRVVLFVSGDGGWNLGVVEMARALARLDAVVVGIDIRQFLRAVSQSQEKCSYPAADFEALSKFVQKRLNFPRYITPLLVGYSSGATLVYAALVQAPPNTFRGAISLGFCPDLLLTKPMCKGNGLEWGPGPKGKGYSFLPAKTLEIPWVALQGTVDQVCNPPATEAFVQQVPQGSVVMLPKVGHGFAVEKNWMPQFKEAFLRLTAARTAEHRAESEDIADLPLIEVPVAKAAPASPVLAVHLTGDGGWGVTDRGLAEALSADGIPVVGWSSLQYFWTPRTPEEATRDLERILRHYLSAWKKERAVLIGYSLGADVLPFLVNRLSPDLRERVQEVVLLGPSHGVDFEFHLSDWLGGLGRKPALAVRPEVEKLKGTPILCFYGDEETDSLCPDLPPTLALVAALEGGHSIGRNYHGIARAILAAVREPGAKPRP